MDYEQFKSDFTEAIKEASYERGMALNFTEQTVEKVNTTYDALTVMPEGSNVGMNINIQNFYENCESGASFEEAVSRAMGMIEQGLDTAPQFNLEAFENYDLLKEKLSMEVIGIAGNESILDRVPHHNMEDMAVVYRYVVDDSPDLIICNTFATPPLLYCVHKQNKQQTQTNKKTQKEVKNYEEN